MRILFVISQLADFTGDAGLMLGIAESLKKLGHELLIVTTDADPFLNDSDSSKKYSEQRTLFSKNIGKKVQFNNLLVLPIHSISNKLGMYCPDAKKIGEEIISQFDVVHIFSWYHHLGIVFSKLSQKFNIPYAFTAFASLQPDAQNFFKRRKQVIDFLYTKKMLENASALHAVGNSEIPIFKAMGVDLKKIYMIENGVDLKKFEIKHQTEILEKIGLNKNKKFILFFGRIHKKKGIEFLLKAFKKFSENHKDIFLIIGGHGEKKYVNEIKKLIEELDIKKLVKFTGYVSHDEKLQLLNSAEIFVLTSLTDVHPHAVQEALVMKTPVIISKECDCPEVEEFEAGKIVELDVNKIYSAMVNLLENPEIILKYSENTVNLVQERFLLENQMKKIIGMYQDISITHKNHN